MSMVKDLSDEEWKDIGNRIKSRRKSCGYRQSELAELVGISLTHMSSIENGRQHPSIYVLIRISEQLNATPDYFLLGNMRTHNVSQNIIESLYLFNESELPLVETLIKALQRHFEKRN